MILDPHSLELWSDASLLVINKPPGLPTLPDGYHPQRPHIRSLLEPLYGRLWIVHRLDKDTSGVLLLARSPAAHRHLNMQFDSRAVHKTYHALVLGCPTWQETTVALPLRPNGDRRHRTVVDPQGGKPALTRLRVLERFTACTLLEASPETGRTHQIRAHLSALGFPLAADGLYGGGENLPLAPDSPPLRRPALHAYSIEISHPLTSASLCFTAPYPADLQTALDWLAGSR